MKTLNYWLLCLLVFSGWASATTSSHSQDCTILLHGLVRSSDSMKKMETTLQEKGHRVVNQSYPSRKHDIATLANIAISEALKQCPQEARINFVTHSLGGILVRQYLTSSSAASNLPSKPNAIPKLHRVVMLGPPNQGSEVVDKLSHAPGFRIINGEAGMQLGTGKTSVPSNLGSAQFDVGVIAGSRSINLILSSIIPGKDDGKVSIENTKLEGMKDHMTLPVTHPFMMKNNKVIEQVIYYLEHGEFKR